MTKIIPQLNFSSSIYKYEEAAVETDPDAKPKKNFEESCAVSAAAAASKRSALSASDAECFCLCLGAGPLWSVHRGPDAPESAAPPGGVRGGAARPATPATPAAVSTPSTPSHDDNCDLLSALLCSTSLSGSAETLLSPARDADADREAVISKILERTAAGPVKIEFKIFLTENTASVWEAVVHEGTLYLRLPGVLSSGSKDSFMTLLDFAEARLGCSSCVVCVRKSRADRAALLRTFMFLGFAPLPPTAAALPPQLRQPDYVFLHYAMD